MATARRQAPSGVVTFLFTDIEGSSRLWENQAELMGPALARHDEIMRAAFEAHEGYVFSLTGDGFAVAFATPANGIDAACQAQQALAAEPWTDPVALRVRMGLHTGTAEERGGDYFGPDVNRAARLMSAGHGGQVLVSSATAALAREAALADLGEHRLKDLSAPEHVYQLVFEGGDTDFPALATVDVRRTNLPVRLDSVVGREGDVDRLVELASTHRCVTICGPGGVGKTTLAQRLAAELARTAPGGAWFVELAPVLEPSAVPYQIADDIGAPQERGRPVLETVADYLGGEAAVLVLDNCEHVLEAAARVVRELEASCPELTVVATSRGPLGVPGERAHYLDPLDCSDVDGAAVELLAERLVEANSGLELGDQRRAVLLEICRRLDGLPLAIELAAARGRSLTPEDILARLDERFTLLRSRNPADDRHATLRSTIEWSYQMLDGADRLLLSRLGVFAGGFDLAAAERVCADARLDELDVLDGLDGLVEQSMVAANLEGPTASYSLLHSIREFALSELGDEVAEFRDRHAAYFAGLTAHLAARAKTADELAAVAALDAAWDDIRAAASHTVERADREHSLRLLGSLPFEVLFRGRAEVSEWLKPALELHRDSLSDRSVALLALEITCAVVRGDHDTVVADGAVYLDALRRHTELRSATDMAVVGLACHLAGDESHALELYDLVIADSDPDSERAGLMWAYALSSLLYAYSARFDEARQTSDAARSLIAPDSAVTERVGIDVIDALRGDDPPEVVADRMAQAVAQATAARSWLIKNVCEMVGAAAHAELGDLPQAMAEAADTLSRHRSSGAFAVLSQQLRRCAVLLMDAGRVQTAALILEFVARQRAPAPNPHTAEQLAAHQPALDAMTADERAGIGQLAGAMSLEEIVDRTIEDLRSASLETPSVS